MALSKTCASWRVQPKWNDLEYLYEYTVPQGKSIKTWKGSTARQPVGDVPSNYHLAGGEEQLFISYIERQDSGFLNTVKTNKTNWLTQD